MDTDVQFNGLTYVTCAICMPPHLSIFYLLSDIRNTDMTTYTPRKSTSMAPSPGRKVICSFYMCHIPFVKA